MWVQNVGWKNFLATIRRNAGLSQKEMSFELQYRKDWMGLFSSISEHDLGFQHSSHFKKILFLSKGRGGTVRNDNSISFINSAVVSFGILLETV